MTETPNLSYIAQLSNGNKMFEKNLLNIIRRELPKEIEAYQSNLSEGNYTESAGCVHKINHKFKILGLINGFKIAEDYRNNLLKNNQVLKLDFEGILPRLLLFIKSV